MVEVSRAEHPCPWRWTRGDEDGSGEERPRQTTIMGDVPPPYCLCEHANYAYMKELETLLLLPTKNTVRRLVIECAADGCHTVRKACKISVDDVVLELEDEVVWFEGFDWLERRKDDRLEARKTKQTTRTMEESSKCDDSSQSSISDGSTTSPVSSTSTSLATRSRPLKGSF
ncbi:hypothetical protein IW261DRAFT_913855 [Armillaria novae-zelandiae]|uniref:Uncharacterized protein n=1 Tax=Armillaria novae-zelandiae TaxID=153914 RepID=A0AA39U5B8_9AGAR|nr:hypothetical protein IW261DRAFT_913855 [Armillaria novae-zelandiae]